jgi:TRAP-type C4-dicarboxylate transport system permease small subunit
VGTYELVGLLGALVIGFAIPQTSRLHGHVLMDFVTAKLPAVAQGILGVISRILGMILFAVIAWNMLSLGNDYRMSGEVTPTLQLPIYPVAYAIAFCCVVECFMLFLETFRKKDTES